MSKYSETRIDYVGFIKDLINLAKSKKIDGLDQGLMKGGIFIREYRTVGFKSIRQAGSTSFIAEWIKEHGVDKCLLVNKDDYTQRHISGLVGTVVHHVPWREYQRNIVNIDANELTHEQLLSLINSLTLTASDVKRENGLPMLKGVTWGWNNTVTMNMTEIPYSGVGNEVVTEAHNVEVTKNGDPIYSYRKLADDVRKGIQYVIVSDATFMFGYGGVRRSDFYDWLFRLHGKDVFVIEVG